MPRLMLAFASLVGSCLLATGCSSDKAPPKVTIVTGTLTYQGKNVEGADVSFTPVKETPTSRSANGKSDAQGKFALKTYLDPQHELNGAIPGDYLVTVTKKEGASASPDELLKLMKAGKPIPAPKDLLPAKYGLPQQSGFKRTVVQGEKNDFQLDMVD